MTLIPFKTRPFALGDRALVLASWINSYYRNAVAPMGFISHQTFTVLYAPIVEKLLHRGKTLVACTPEDPDTIIGWVCYEGPVLHYAWVKEPYRYSGMLTTILENLVLKETSHMTLMWFRHISKKFPLKYRPEAA